MTVSQQMYNKKKHQSTRFDANRAETTIERAERKTEQRAKGKVRVWHRLITSSTHKHSEPKNTCSTCVAQLYTTSASARTSTMMLIGSVKPCASAAIGATGFKERRRAQSNTHTYRCDQRRC